jgi:hypothetical protein
MHLLLAPLPGLYLLLLGFLLDRALRRWWDPVPWRVWATAGLVLLALFAPALFGGRVLLSGDIVPGLVVDGEGRPVSAVLGNPLHLDVVTQIVPLEAQVRRALQAGAWPQWNPLAGAGMPLLADPQAQALQPLVAIAWPLPLPQALAVTAGLRVLLPLVFLFLFLRRQGLSSGAALFGGITFALSGSVLLWLQWPIANAAAWLPVIFYALDRTAERGARRDFALLTAAGAATLLGGHPETALYVVATAALYGLSRLATQPRDRRGRLLGRWTLAAALAAGLAAPVLLPAAQYLPQTHRHAILARRNARLLHPRPLRNVPAETAAVSTPAAPAASPAAAPWRRLGASFAPGAGGPGAGAGESNLNEDAMGFAGTLAWLGALLALLPARKRFAGERLFLGLWLLGLAVAARPPGIERLFARLPLLGQSATFHHRLLLPVAFAGAILAACAYERWQRGELPRGAIAGAAALLATGLAGLYATVPATAGGPIGAATASGGGLPLQIGVLAAATLVTLRGARRRPATALALLAGFAALELILTFRSANPALPRERFYPTTPALAFLQQSSRPGDRLAGLGDRLWPGVAHVYGLADARISNPMKPYFYTRAVAPLLRSPHAIEDLFLLPDHPLYQLLGVRYVVAGPHWRRPDGLRAAYRDRTARIFERAPVLPRLFLPAAAEPEAGPDSSAWLAANRDFAALALVRADPAHVTPWRASRPELSRVVGLRLGAGRLVARLALAEQRLAVVSVYQDGGWRLLVDARPHPTTRADGPFLGAWIEAGEHRLDLLYRAPGLMAGLLCAALAVTLGALFSLGPPAPRRASA